MVLVSVVHFNSTIKSQDMISSPLRCLCVCHRLQQPRDAALQPLLLLVASLHLGGQEVHPGPRGDAHDGEIGPNTIPRTYHLSPPCPEKLSAVQPSLTVRRPVAVLLRET